MPHQFRFAKRNQLQFMTAIIEVDALHKFWQLSETAVNELVHACEYVLVLTVLAAAV